MSKIIIISPRDPKPDGIIINTTSKSKNWSKGLSPFVLGPCKLYNGFVSITMENAWQYSKVYACHIDKEPTEEYWQWAKAGWASSWANRYPMGKGAIPEYSLWNGEKLNYVEARKKIYVPLYYNAVKNTKAYEMLREIYQKEEIIYLWDFDGYDHEKLGMTLKDVLNHPGKKMGHAFVLANMLKRGI